MVLESEFLRQFLEDTMRDSVRLSGTMAEVTKAAAEKCCSPSR